MPKRNDNTRKQKKLREKNKKKVTKRKQFRKGKLVSLKKNMKQRMAKGISCDGRPSKRRKCAMNNDLFSKIDERMEKSRYEPSPINFRRGEGKFSPTDDAMVEAVLKLSEEKMQSLSKEGKKNLREMLDSKGTFIFHGTLRSLVEKRYIPFRNDRHVSGYWSTSLMFNITMARPIEGKPPVFSRDSNKIESGWIMYQAGPREAQEEAPGGYERMEQYKRYIEKYLQPTGYTQGNPVAYHMINQEFGGGPVMPTSHDLNMGIKSFENTLKNVKNRIFTDNNFDASEKIISKPDKPIVMGELAMIVSCIRPAWENETAMSYNEVYRKLELPQFTSNNRIFDIPGGITAVVRHVISFGVIALRPDKNRFYPMSPQKIESYWDGFIDFINNSSADGRGLNKLGFSNISQKRGNIYLFESEIKQQYRRNSNSRVSMAAAVDSPPSHSPIFDEWFSPPNPPSPDPYQDPFPTFNEFWKFREKQRKDGVPQSPIGSGRTRDSHYADKYEELKKEYNRKKRQ